MCAEQLIGWASREGTLGSARTAVAPSPAVVTFHILPYLGVTLYSQNPKTKGDSRCFFTVDPNTVFVKAVSKGDLPLGDAFRTVKRTSFLGDDGASLKMARRSESAPVSCWHAPEPDPNRSPWSMTLVRLPCALPNDLSHA